MKKSILITFILISLSFVCFGQNYIESKNLKLSDFDYEAYYKKAEQTGEYGYDKIFLIDEYGNKINEFKIFPESYESDGIVYESSDIEFKNIKKKSGLNCFIVPVIVKHLNTIG